MKLLNAYLDNELDDASRTQLEARLASDAALKAELELLVALKGSMRQHLVKERVSAGLLRRVAAIPDVPASASPARNSDNRGRNFDWRQMAAAVLFAAVSASSVTYWTLERGAPSYTLAALVGAHEQALLKAEPFEVASSDRHTVKPWLSRKVALSPKVVDLAADGFPLAGGRVDHLAGTALPALVYTRHGHVISVIATPEPGSKDMNVATSRQTLDGFTVLRWNGQDFIYAAISDVAEGDLARFVELWRRDSLQHE